MNWKRGLMVSLGSLSLALGVAFAAEGDKAGLTGKYYSFDAAVEDFPTIAADKKPDLVRVDAQLNWEGTDGEFADSKLSDHFYVKWTGKVRAPKDGKYTFFLESDDGSRLWIDGKEVVNNGGLHAMEEKSAEIDLKAGDHDIVVELFENEGFVGLKLSWQVEGVEKQVVPANALFHAPEKKAEEKK